MLTPFELLFVQPHATTVSRAASSIKRFMGCPVGFRKCRKPAGGTGRLPGFAVGRSYLAVETDTDLVVEPAGVLSVQPTMATQAKAATIARIFFIGNSGWKGRVEQVEAKLLGGRNGDGLGRRAGGGRLAVAADNGHDGEGGDEGENLLHGDS